jgi:hypothetical protein
MEVHNTNFLRLVIGKGSQNLILQVPTDCRERRKKKHVILFDFVREVCSAVKLLDLSLVAFFVTSVGWLFL